jgi:predicted ATP-dependent endonuclease of OLD family
MFIYAVNIKNFRSFENQWLFPNPEINVIVGPNNCGKSTMLRGLSLVMDPAINYRQHNLVSRFDFHCLNIAQPIEIVIWLKPATHTNDKGNVVYDDSDPVKRAFFDKMSTWNVETHQRDITGVIEIHPYKVVPIILEPMQKLEESPAHERLLAIRLQSAWNESIETTETEVDIIDECSNKLTPLNYKQKELLGFKMVGGRRNPLFELSLSKQSLLSKMVDDGEVNLALRELLSQLDGNKDNLLNKQSISGLMQRLSRSIAPELIGSVINNLGTEFSLTFLGSDLWRLRGATSISTIIANDSENKFTLPLEYQGDGAQNVILIAHLIDLIREPKDNDIVVLEEPEQNLEPSLSRWIFGELCSLSHKKNQQIVGQLFVTTHSPALVSELKGAESLLVFSDNVQFQANPEEIDCQPHERWQVIPARVLSPDSRKKLDQQRDRYIAALFARQVLIVEGNSEIGFLPVAFRYFSKGLPGENPYHLGLEIINGEDKGRIIIHAKNLRSYGKKCHLLFDNDEGDADEEKRSRKSRYDGKVDFVTCWPEANLLSFVSGCDLEVILSHYISPQVLFEAIKYVYDDAGHPLKEQDWKKALKLINDLIIREKLPNVYGDFNLMDYDLNNLGDDLTKRAFLFALLHGPHECKSTKDMRMIAEYLADKQAIPEVFNDLRKKILLSMTKPDGINHDDPYLAAK